jgi:LPXTG-motif cell wall-anchored protein
VIDSEIENQEPIAPSEDTIQNEQMSQKVDSNNVQTGDETSKTEIAIWMMLLLSAGTAAVVARRKRRVE